MRHLSLLLAVLFSATALGSSSPAVPVKYTLPNGMKVILSEDHTLPIATINIWYGVGAQDEPPGRSGFAHLFEHLMFMGTQRVPDNQFDVLMESGGGANNASTDLHRTNYYSWGPSKLLPTLLWLDADRLEDMGLQMTAEKLNKQRDVVRNELRQSIENTPYGKAREAVYKLLYPSTHPYYYGVIGSHTDLEAANVNNVKDFFANFYVPNNASLVVAGDFDSAEIRPLIDQLFGSLPAGQPIVRKYSKPTTAIPGKLDGIKRLTTLDQVELPKVQFTYHSPVAYGPGDAQAHLAGIVLGQGKSSRLYKRLVVTEKLVSQVSATQMGYPLGGQFQVEVLAKPDADLARVEKIMDEEIAQFLKQGPTAQELSRTVSTLELGALTQLQSLQARADSMNEYEYYWGTPDGFKRDLDRFRNATPAAVKDWAGKVLTQNARVIVHVLPEKTRRNETARDKRPNDNPVGEFSVPEAQTFELANGLKVMVWPRTQLPLVSMSLVRSPEGALDAKGQQGLGALAIRMMGEGAGQRDALAYENALQLIGAKTGFGAGHDQISASLTVVKRNLDAGAALFADAVRRPRFDVKEWERVKSITLAQLKQRDSSPPQVATVVANRALYEDANPYAWPVNGIEKTVNGLNLDAAKETYARLVRPDGAVLLIAGDISVDEAKAMTQKMFGDWKVEPKTSVTPAAADYSIPPQKAPRLIIVDRPGATQTTIQFIAPGVKFTDPSRVQRELLNTLLGGSFTSRLNQNLREDKGYTYGARSNFALNVQAGDFSAGANVQASVTGASLKEFMKEFDRIRAGDVTQDEVTKARETFRNTTVSGFESLSGLMISAAERVANGQSLGTVTTDMTNAAAVDANAINALAKTALPLDNAILVLVGDKAVILEQIKDLKLPTPVEMTVEGEKK